MSKVWKYDGVVHRDNGPAMEDIEVDDDREVKIYTWYNMGRRTAVMEMRNGQVSLYTPEQNIQNMLVIDTTTGEVDKVNSYLADQ
jgi:hypothetical protein